MTNEKEISKITKRKEFPVYVKTGLFSKILIGTATLTKHSFNSYTEKRIKLNITERFK